MRRRLPTTACALALLLGVPTAAAQDERPSRSPVVVEVSDDGFDWGDAAIGAAAAIGVGLAGAGIAHSGSKPNNHRREP